MGRHWALGAHQIHALQIQSHHLSQGFGVTTKGQPKVRLTSCANTSAPKKWKASPKSINRFFGADLSTPNVSQSHLSLTLGVSPNPRRTIWRIKSSRWTHRRDISFALVIRAVGGKKKKVGTCAILVFGMSRWWKCYRNGPPIDSLDQQTSCTPSISSSSYCSPAHLREIPHENLWSN